MKKQNKMPLVEALQLYNEDRPAYFCIPGHRYERGVSSQWLPIEDRQFLQYDLTEAHGLDDLHQPSAAIKEAQELAADLFGAVHSFMLVNGTTCGIEAMIMAAAGPNEEILIPRNAHKSVMMGLIMSGAKPVYVMPEWIDPWCICGGITPAKIEAKLKQHPDVRATVVVSPTYYGLCSDLRSIAGICHEREIPLLVDEAHGAHLYFSDMFPDGALQQGADVSVQSFHKVTGALTQSSMLHIGSGRISADKMQSHLQIVQSTSPSYLLMSSIDAARYELAVDGKTMVEKAAAYSNYTRAAIREVEGISCLGAEVINQYGICGLDQTKLTLSAAELGISGFELRQQLFELYNVDTELADEHNVLAIITYANEKKELERLVQGLRSIAEQKQENKAIETIIGAHSIFIPPMSMTPREAYFSKKRRIPWSQAQGKIAGEPIIPYPPGIPVLYPGEMINSEVWNYTEYFRQQKKHFHGPADQTLETVEIIAE